MVLTGTAVQARVSQVDDQGKAVVLDTPAQRLVSLSPGITEVLFALGAGERLVGVSAASDFPAAAATLPIVSQAGQINLEAIARSKADLIVGWPGGYDPRLLATLSSMGAALYQYEPKTLDDIANSAQRLAVLTHTEQAASGVIADFRRRLEHLKLTYQHRKRIRVFVQIWPHPLMTPGKQSLTNDMLKTCGADGLFADLPVETATVSPESVVLRSPDLILANEPGGVDRGALQQWRSLAQMPVVRRQHLRILNADQMERSALRTIEGAEALCRHIDDARDDSR
jgi:iron complex transport system substrate-binding protein